MQTYKQRPDAPGTEAFASEKLFRSPIAAHEPIFQRVQCR